MNGKNIIGFGKYKKTTNFLVCYKKLLVYERLSRDKYILY